MKQEAHSDFGMVVRTDAAALVVDEDDDWVDELIEEVLGEDAPSDGEGADGQKSDGSRLMRTTINGKGRDISASLTVSQLLGTLGLDSRKIAIERNLEIVPCSAYGETVVDDGDRLEIVHFIGGGDAQAEADGASEATDDDTFEVAGRRYRSRLIVGTGKYKDFEETARAIEASGAEIVTVAVRRVNITDAAQEMLVDYVDPTTYTYLPNTAGCYTAEDAVRTLRLAREAGGWNLVKLEVLGDEKTLYPEMPETLRAAEKLVADGFEVMVYCNDDPIQAKRLEEIGCVAVMPLAAPIGSGLGVQNPVNIRIIVENIGVPVLVDAGVGSASDAAVAMELGCDGVLMNTAIAEAKDPIKMARAMKPSLGVMSSSQTIARKASTASSRAFASPSATGAA